MQPIETRTPTAIGDISISLLDLADPPEGAAAQQGRFEIQVLDQEGQVVHDWFRRGDLVPYLNGDSTYLSVADRTALINLLGRIRQEASLRILGV